MACPEDQCPLLVAGPTIALMSTPSALAAPALDLERPKEVLLAAGGLGLAFQWLFWGARPGLAFTVFVTLVLAALWWTARRQAIRPARSTVALALAAMLLAGGVAVRAEPLTTAANMLVAAGLLGVVVHAFGSDVWLRYGLRDWLRAALRLAGHELTGAPGLVRAANRCRPAEDAGVWRGTVLPVVRGAAIAAPLLVLLAVLLASADAVFAARLSRLRVDLPPMDETVARLLLAAVAAYGAAGALWHLIGRRRHRVPAEQAVPRVLGFTEAAVVLGSVNVLFAVFVGIQLRYFFGGHAAVVAEGMTFAAYARRGFGELVVVAGVSLALHLALAGLTRRESAAQRWAFTSLTTALTGLVLVILASAFGRLLLYEQAFGFTRLRTAVHVFMVWLALLLVAVLVLELADRLRLFLVAVIVAAVGFAVTLNVVGVDALIVRHNVARAAHGAELDVHYLQQLSADAVPAMVAALPDLRPALAAEVAGAAACIQQRADEGDWRSLRVADIRARSAVARMPHPVACWSRDVTLWQQTAASPR